MILLTDEEVIAGKDPAVLSTELTRQERLNICTACEAKTEVLGFDVCSKCDCIIKLKTFFKLAPCPLNKWVLNSEDLPKGEPQ